MDKIIGYFLLVFRLAFLPLRSHTITKKWKIVLLLTANIVMMYFVFIFSIHSGISKFTQVDKIYGVERATLDIQEKKIKNIIIKNARRMNPNMIRIVPSATLEAERK